MISVWLKYTDPKKFETGCYYDRLQDLQIDGEKCPELNIYLSKIDKEEILDLLARAIKLYKEESVSSSSYTMN